MLVEKAAIIRPIFIVGTVRSGTTLLAEMLDRSPHIAYCPFELKDLWSQAGGIPMASAKTRDLICPQCSGMDMQVDQRESLTASFFRRMTTCVGKAPGATFLNKNPHLSNKLPLVSALFPDARFIWIYRDLPQVVASIKRLFEDVCQRQGTWHWWPYLSVMTGSRCWNAFHSPDLPQEISAERIFPGGDVGFIAEYWLEANRGIRDFFKQVPASVRIEIAEESLVASPAENLANIAAKLKIPLMNVDTIGTVCDLSRNQQWRQLLDEHQRKRLIDFVQMHAEDIDSIFPADPRRSRYLALLDDVRAARA
jgi:Sulfotransferase family